MPEARQQTATATTTFKPMLLNRQASGVLTTSQGGSSASFGPEQASGGSSLDSSSGNVNGAGSGNQANSYGSYNSGTPIMRSSAYKNVTAQNGKYCFFILFYFFITSSRSLTASDTTNTPAISALIRAKYFPSYKLDKNSAAK